MSALPAPLFGLDMLHVAGFVGWHQPIIAELRALAWKVKRRGSYRQRAWDDVFRERDNEPDSPLHAMTIEQLRREVSRRIELLQEDEGQTTVARLWSFAGREWSVSESGKKLCDLTMQSGPYLIHVRLGKPSEAVANVHIEVGSLALWSAPWRETVRGIGMILRALGSEIKPHNISRVDLAWHCQGLGTLDYDRFVTRASRNVERSKNELILAIDEAVAAGKWEQFKERFKAQVSYKRGRVTETIEFGSRTDLMCRIYIKSNEIRINPEKSEFFKGRWAAAGFDMSQPVYNVEFQLMRDWLRENALRMPDGAPIAIDTIYDLVEHIETLKAYLVGSENSTGWLRMVAGTATRAKRDAVHWAWRRLWSTVDQKETVEFSKRVRPKASCKAREIVKRLGRTLAYTAAALGIMVRPPSDAKECVTEHFCRQVFDHLLSEHKLLVRAKKAPSIQEIFQEEAAALGIIYQWYDNEFYDYDAIECAFDPPGGNAHNSAISA